MAIIGKNKYVLLTEKEKRFVDAFVETGNMQLAAKEAGYATNYKSLEKLYDRMRPLIDDRIKMMDAKKIASTEEILQFLTGVMRGEEKETIVVYNDGEAEVVDKKPAMRDRIKSAENLGKAKGMFIENRKVDTELTIHFGMDYGSESDYKVEVEDDLEQLTEGTDDDYGD